MLAYYLTQKSNMASKMAAYTSKWPQIRNYWLKFDDLDVYPQVFGGKEHINTIKMTLNHYLTSKSNMASNVATGTSIFPTFHHSNVVIFVSILRFMDARTTLKQLWISLSCWIIVTLNSWPSAVHYHLMHKDLCPYNKFQSVKFWVSSSSSVSTSWVSVVWIVTVFSLARATCSSAGESIASPAASRRLVFPRTVAMDNFQDFISRSILFGHNWN